MTKSDKLFEAILREMGYTPIQQAANFLRNIITTLTTPTGKSKDAEKKSK